MTLTYGVDPFSGYNNILDLSEISFIPQLFLMNFDSYESRFKSIINNNSEFRKFFNQLRSDGRYIFNILWKAAENTSNMIVGKSTEIKLKNYISMDIGNKRGSVYFREDLNLGNEPQIVMSIKVENSKEENYRWILRATKTEDYFATFIDFSRKLTYTGLLNVRYMEEVIKLLLALPLTLKKRHGSITWIFP